MEKSSLPSQRKIKKRIGIKGRPEGSPNKIQTDKETCSFYCSLSVWQDAKKKYGRKLSQLIEDFLRMS